MTSGNQGPVEQHGLVFFGTLAASVTHELNNVLSVIDQGKGLLEDLAVGARSGRAIDPAMLETVTTRIDRQVRKGIEIMGCLNRFAHSLDEPRASFDAGFETGNLLSLARRFADLKKVRLEFSPGEGEIRAAGNAFLLQQAIFTCLQRVLEESEEGDRIDIDMQLDADEVVVGVTGSARFRVDQGDSWFQRLTDLMQSLEGRCQVRADGEGRMILELRSPAAGG
jgi:hypothetical protein